MAKPILSIRNLVVEFESDAGTVRAADGISYDVYPGETLAVVGESGSGKTVSALAILGLIPTPAGRIVSGEIRYAGTDLPSLGTKELRSVRGGEIAMVFQDPMTSLNPVQRVGDQIAETIKVHRPATQRKDRRLRVIELLGLVGIPEPEQRARQYPHELSGGMRQRAMIALAIANDPRLLIADEPTTALDVTIQAQILDVLRTAKEETNAATILITHDLGLVSELADRVAVLYAGRVVEVADVFALFASPRHPYTVGLLKSVPRLSGNEGLLEQIPGQPPSLVTVPRGCPFHPRCFLWRGRERCTTDMPELRAMGGAGHLSACHFAEELALVTASPRERTPGS